MFDNVLVLVGSGGVLRQVGPVPLSHTKSRFLQLSHISDAARRFVRTGARAIDLLRLQMGLTANVRVEARTHTEQRCCLGGLDVVSAGSKSLAVRSLRL